MLINLVYIFYGFAAIGGLYDRQKYGPWLEFIRIIVILGLSRMYPMFSPGIVTTFVAYVHYADLLIWFFVLKYVNNYSPEAEDKATQKNAAVSEKAEQKKPVSPRVRKNKKMAANGRVGISDLINRSI